MSDNSIDSRQASIVYQNQSHLALALLIHNSKGEKVEPKDVVDLALKLTRVAVNPVHHMKRQEE